MKVDYFQKLLKYNRVIEYLYTYLPIFFLIYHDSSYIYNIVGKCSRAMNFITVFRTALGTSVISFSGNCGVTMQTN